MLTTSDFKRPEKHPWSMLYGYNNASEKEQVLAAMLCGCIDNGSLGQEFDLHGFVIEQAAADGLLVKCGTKYKLSNKSIGLLYGVYGVCHG